MSRLRRHDGCFGLRTSNDFAACRTLRVGDDPGRRRPRSARTALILLGVAVLSAGRRTRGDGSWLPSCDDEADRPGDERGGSHGPRRAG